MVRRPFSNNTCIQFAFPGNKVQLPEKGFRLLKRVETGRKGKTEQITLKLSKMNLIKKYDKTLRRRVALRAVWLPGTIVKPGDILLAMNDALTAVGNLGDEKIDYTVSSIGQTQSINLQSNGVSRTLVQNGATVSLAGLDTEAEAELKLTFKEEDSYFLRTPALSGEGLDQAMTVARKIAKIASWDHLQNYVVHKVWSAEDFVFLGNMESEGEIVFSGKGAFVKGLLENGFSTGLTRTGSQSMSLEIMGKSGALVMQVFRVKRNGDIF